MKNNKVTIDICLFAVTISWAVAMIFMRIAEPYSGGLTYVFLRFFVGSVILAIIFCKRLKNLTKPILLAGLAIGCFQAISLGCINIALRYTTMTNAGFIGSLFVVFTPIIMALIHRKLPSQKMLISIFIATIGLALLTLGENISFNIGDVIALLSTLSYVGVIILITKYSELFDPFLLTISQTFGATISAFVIACIFEWNTPFTHSVPLWLAVLAGAVTVNVLSGILQNVMQKKTSENRASLIYSTVPVFTAIQGIIIYNDPFTWKVIIGGTLIMLAVFYDPITEATQTKLDNSKS